MGVHVFITGSEQGSTYSSVFIFKNISVREGIKVEQKIAIIIEIVVFTQIPPTQYTIFVKWKYLTNM